MAQNFDDLGFPADHPGRRPSDSYYLNAEYMLRTHTSAHEVQNFREGKEKWLLTADVYRRDEIDASHYPVFHQMEGCNVGARSSLEAYRLENTVLQERLLRSNIEIHDQSRVSDVNPIQAEHSPEDALVILTNLKNSLNNLIFALFGQGRKDAEPLKVRWIDATFPWTSPSFEVEVFFEGRWLEILGCGVVRQETLSRAGEHSALMGGSCYLQLTPFPSSRCTPQIRMGVWPWP